MNHRLPSPPPADLLERAEPLLPVLRALGRVRAGQGGCVWVIEDLHWADEATLDGVRYLGRRLADAGFLLMLSLRAGALEAQPPLRQTLAALDPAVTTRIALAPLSAEALRSAAASGDADSRLRAGSIAASVALSVAPTDEAFDALQRCISEAMAAGRADRAAVPMVNLASLALHHGALARVLAVTDQGITSCGPIRMDPPSVVNEFQPPSVAQLWPPSAEYSMFTDCSRDDRPCAWQAVASLTLKAMVWKLVLWSVAVPAPQMLAPQMPALQKTELNVRSSAPLALSVVSCPTEHAALQPRQGRAEGGLQVKVATAWASRGVGMPHAKQRTPRHASVHRPGFGAEVARFSAGVRATVANSACRQTSQPWRKEQPSGRRKRAPARAVAAASASVTCSAARAPAHGKRQARNTPTNDPESRGLTHADHLVILRPAANVVQMLATGEEARCLCQSGLGGRSSSTIHIGYTMKKVLFGLSLIACVFTASAESTAAVNCISFAPAGFCDSMQYDSARRATWVQYDCAGSSGRQTKASYRRGTTSCDGAAGCNPSAAYGWDSLSWKFNKTASTGTLTGVVGGVPQTLVQDIPVSITAGACAAKAAPSGISTLSR